MLKQLSPELEQALSSGNVRSLRKTLLDWYKTSQRDLPWRRETDPYPVWISEVMLQQTQVKTVIPYYRKFLAAFPTIQALAEASTNDLLRLWAGLGYYSRARSLQKAARVIVEQFSGVFPSNYDDVLALPGVGRYTAAAIASIAFNLPHAVVDGNVARVLARLLALRGEVKSRAVQELLWDTAQRLVSGRQPGEFNQAIMELGATLCLPRKPRCEVCPWRRRCLAFAAGIQTLLPENSRRPPTRNVRRAAVVIRHRSRYFLVHRSEQKLLKDFWEFPTIDLGAGQATAEHLAGQMAAEFGLQLGGLERLMTVKHSITTRRIVMDVFVASLARRVSSKTPDNQGRWVSLSEIERYPLASASRQVLARLQEKDPT